MKSGAEGGRGERDAVDQDVGGDAAMVDLMTERPIWEQFFLPSPLVLVGTKEGDGFDLAPKHLAMPLSWENYFGFVCTPRHATYHNATREGAFTVSVPRPAQLVATSLAAQPRDDSGATTGIELLPTEAAQVVDGVVLRDAHLHLECELDRVVDGFGVNSLVAGKVVAARVNADALRASGKDDSPLLTASPLLVYVSPGRFAEVSQSQPFPFPADFSR